MPDEPVDAAPARDLPAADAAPPPPVKRARPATSAPRKAPTKRAPAKRAAARATPAPEAAPETAPETAAAAGGPWPVRATPAPPPKPLRPEPVRPEPVRPAPAADLAAAAVTAAAPVTAAAAAADPAPVTAAAAAEPAPVPPGRGRDAVVRFLVTLAVLLLAAAAGLAAAAAVEHRDTRYRADTLVRLEPGVQPTDPVTVEVALGVHRYATVTASSGYRQDTARQAHLPVTALKAVRATPVGGDTLRLTVSATSARRARSLAAGAGAALVETVDLTEAADQPSAGDRLGATVLSGPTAVARTAAAPRDAWLAALLAAAAVLALAGAAAVLSSSRRR